MIISGYNIFHSKEKIVMKKTGSKWGSVIVGLVFILIGAGIAAKKLGYEFDLSSLLFDGWWTLFIIVPGVIGLFRKDSNKVFSVVLIAVGALLLAGQYTELNIWGWVAPVAVAAVGVSSVARAFGKKTNGDAKADNEDTEGKDGKEDAE